MAVRGHWLALALAFVLLPRTLAVHDETQSVTSLDARFVADTDNWLKVFSKGTVFGEYVPQNAEQVFNDAFALNGIVVRLCDDCLSTHKQIVYARKSPTTDSFNAYQNFLITWRSAKNTLNQDFELYSSLNSFESGLPRWTYCNYDDNEIGFPRDCGPSSKIDHQWTSLTRALASSKKEFVYYVYVGLPTGEWPVSLSADGAAVSVTAPGSAVVRGNRVHVTGSEVIATVSGEMRVQKNYPVATESTSASRDGLAADCTGENVRAMIYDGTSFVCACNSGWSGANCATAAA